jgi:hypothetical protein
MRACDFQTRIWLENLTVAQATWRAGFDDGRALGADDVRGGAYPLLRHPLARRLVGLAMRTPLCALAANDIYAVARPTRARGEDAASPARTTDRAGAGSRMR